MGIEKEYKWCLHQFTWNSGTLWMVGLSVDDSFPVPVLIPSQNMWFLYKQPLILMSLIATWYVVNSGITWNVLQSTSITMELTLARSWIFVHEYSNYLDQEIRGCKYDALIWAIFSWSSFPDEYCYEQYSSRYHNFLLVFMHYLSMKIQTWKAVFLMASWWMIW